MPHYGDLQTQIYGAGLSGVVPTYPVDFATLEKRAQSALPPHVLTYVQGGCGDEYTQDENARAFRHWGMVPRMMVDATHRDLSIELFGLKLPSPLFMAPIGVTGMMTQDQHGDVAAAQASAMTGVPLTASTLSNDPLEDVKAACGETPAFFQLYTPRDKELAESLVGRAEAAGYKAIVVTLDTWVTGWRPRDLNPSNFPQLRGHVLQNYFVDPRFRQMLGGKAPEEDLHTAIGTWGATFGKVLTWDDMAWLKSITKLPIVLKGICHPDDARRAIDSGADGIYVSNHGGRQLDGVLSTAKALPAIADVVGDDLTVLVDSGIRSGLDVVRMLALGAKTCLLGRSTVYALAADGQHGVENMLDIFSQEMRVAMTLTGVTSIDKIDRTALVPVE